MNKLIKAKNNLVRKLKENKDDIFIGFAVGIPTAGCVILGSELIARETIAKQIYIRLANGEVLEQVVSGGGKLIIKIVKAGEEVCSCEHP